MKVKLRYLILVAALVAVVAIVYASYSAVPAEGRYDDFAKCLSEKGVTMYGAYWCPHCKNQKEVFGSSFKYVNYVECDPRGNGARPDLCKEKGIEGYPTWIYGESRMSGEQTLQSLSSVSGCSLPS